MKKLALVVCLIGILAYGSEANAQGGYEVSGVVVGSGENPITSGLSGTVQLKNKSGGYLEVTAQEEQAWVMGGKDFERGR